MDTASIISTIELGLLGLMGIALFVLAAVYPTRKQ